MVINDSKNKLNIISMVFLIGIPFFCFGQTYKISGIVKDSIKSPISFAALVISNDVNESSIIAYTTSDNNGAYKLAFQTKLDSVWVTCRQMSHKKGDCKLNSV